VRRLALVHDYFTQRGGGERLAERVAWLYPDAPVFTSVVDEAVAPESLRGRLISSRLQRLYDAGVPLPLLGPLLPGALGALDLGDVDVVLSSSAAFGHHVRPRPGRVHICYCHTPAAFLYRPDYFDGRPLARVGSAPGISWLRRRDQGSAGRVHRYVANSAFTARRIKAAYGIESAILHPPVNTGAFSPSVEDSGRFLVVSRLRRHKAVDLAVQTATVTGLPLDVIGEGSDRARLESIAGPSVRFLGWRSDEEVAAAMARCVALVVPGIEDFGMVSAEAQAAGRPVIGAAAGGTAEIVTDGVTGFLVDERTVEGFAIAMERARRERLDPAALVASARRFDTRAFALALERIISETCAATYSSVGVAAAG